jgi:hypothetical protein
MYVENKSGNIDGVAARIGWVSFSKSGRSIYYRGRELTRANGGNGNHIDAATGDVYWVSGVKVRGSNAHWAKATEISVDEDARSAYEELRARHAV